MTSSRSPRAFFAVDAGSASTSAGVLGHLGGRWRLIGHTTVPAGRKVEAVVRDLLIAVHRADGDILDELGANGEQPAELVKRWPMLLAETTPPRRIAILAGSRRQRRRLEDAAIRAGWLTVGGSADDDDPIAMSRLLSSSQIHAVLLGADHVPGGDEKRHLADLAALVAAATSFRPELTIVLAGGAAAYESAFALDEPESETASTGEIRLDSNDSTASIAMKDTAKAVATGKADAQTKRRPRGQQPARDDSTERADEPTEPTEPLGATERADEPTESVRAADSTGVGSDAGSSESEAPEATAPSSTIASPARGQSSIRVLLAPDAEAGTPPGASLQQVLEGLRAYANDSRLAVGRCAASLAYLLDRSIEVVEIGLQGGLLARSDPFGQGHFTTVSTHACLAEASFAPEEVTEEAIDGIVSWSTYALDRHRVMDRLRDLRSVPWGEADGDGAIFRLAAAKAAFGRLVDVLPELRDKPMPEMLIAAGGIFATLPPPTVALALADLVRRPGIGRLVSDPARLLGPLGTIGDEAERRRILANLADDILLPIGTLLMPAGMRPGRSAGSIQIKGSGTISEIEMHPGALQVVDLPPGRTARANLTFRDAVRLPKRGHHFSVDVEGGLAGLLIDLREIPMRISDRPDSRRAALDAWQRGMWSEIDE